jgi:chorismate synthase
MLQMGDIRARRLDWSVVDANPFFFPDAERVPELAALIQRLLREGDSVGALIRVVATGVFPGLGEPVFDRLDADIAYAMMGINAVKGVEIGAGFGVVTQRGSAHRDEMVPEGFLGNHAGGMLGGISSGQDIEVSLALKPTSSIRIPGRTITVHGEAAEIVTTGRHDPCVGIRAAPIAEAMLALTLMDHVLRHRAQNAGVVCATPVLAARAGETPEDPAG